jgi:hypothetical protein
MIFASENRSPPLHRSSIAPLRVPLLLVEPTLNVVQGWDSQIEHALLDGNPFQSSSVRLGWIVKPTSVDACRQASQTELCK